MSGQDLLIDLQSKLAMLDKAVDKLALNGRKLAQAERDYRMALAEEMLIKRESGMPVTMLGDICRGMPKIAALKFERDTAQAVYDANQEAINVWKLQAKMQEAAIQREWGRN